MQIRHMTEGDSERVLEMMRIFYSSPAVLTDGSEKIWADDIRSCLSDNPYIEGYVFEEDCELLGYSMVARSYSTEFGKPCVWIEDIYIKDEHRGRGIGGSFLTFIGERYSDSVIRLEVEAENERAVHVYEKGGFKVLPYLEMIKL